MRGLPMRVAQHHIRSIVMRKPGIKQLISAKRHHLAGAGAGQREAAPTKRRRAANGVALRAGVFGAAAKKAWLIARALEARLHVIILGFLIFCHVALSCLAWLRSCDKCAFVREGRECGGMLSCIEHQ